MISCQDNINESTESLSKIQADTRAVSESNDYYWYKNEKIPLNKVEDKSFILFKSQDENSLLSALSKAKIRVDANNIKEFNYCDAHIIREDTTNYNGYSWVEVNMGVKTAYQFPEVIYAAPYFNTEVFLDDFPLTNLIYVILKDDIDTELLKEVAEKNNVGVLGKYEGVPHLYIAHCTKDSKGNALEMANAFYETGLFEAVEPGFMAIKLASPNDYYYSQQWNLENTGQYGSSYAGYDINYSQSYGTCSSNYNIIIAIIDGGVELTHPDLNFTSFSWDYSNSYSTSHVYNNHGTNVAGIAAAQTNNTIGIAGVASGADIMSLSVQFENNAYYPAQINSALRDAADQGADVINLSWYGSLSSVIDSGITYAIENGRNGKGCVIVCCSGNAGNSSISFPASHTPETEVISVGAISYNGKRKPYVSGGWGSNYGTNLDLVAPGVQIRTTTTNSSYVTNFYGTSAAAAHVSGLAALILDTNYNLTYKEVAYIIQSTANKLSNYSFSNNSSKMGGTWNSQVGHGLIDMQAAIQLAYSTLGVYGNPVAVSGQTTLTADSNGYAYTTLTATPSNSNYTYLWSGEFYGQCDRWYVSPNGTYGTGNTANVSIYLNPNDTGGTLMVTCRVFNGTTFIGSGSAYINVTP